jgi:hypothetical protein
MAKTSGRRCSAIERERRLPPEGERAYSLDVAQIADYALADATCERTYP